MLQEEGLGIAFRGVAHGRVEDAAAVVGADPRDRVGIDVRLADRGRVEGDEQARRRVVVVEIVPLVDTVEAGRQAAAKSVSAPKAEPPAPTEESSRR